jgi:hypothetical protein
MKISEKLELNFGFELLNDTVDHKSIVEAMDTDPNAETITSLEPISTEETPKDRDDRTGKKKGVSPLDTQDLTKTQEMDPEDTRKTQVMDIPDDKFKKKLNKLIILAYKTSYDNFNRAKGKTAKSGYETIMHLASTIHKNIDQIKGPAQLNQVLQHVANGRDRYIEVARSYQQFYNSLKNLS